MEEIKLKENNLNKKQPSNIEAEQALIGSILVNNDINTKNENDIFSAFKIVGEFLDKSILKPNNISFPSSRIEFGKLIKQI